MYVLYGNTCDGVSVWFLELFFLVVPTALLFLVGSVEDGAEETAIDSRGIENDRVFLIVAGVREDGNNGIDA